MGRKSRGWVIAVLVCLAGGAWAQREVTVTVQPNQSIRAIAQEYLGDPNLWEDILRANDLTSPDQARPGVQLIIPVHAIQTANKNVQTCSDLIHEATRAGARMFAADQIQQAINLRDRAIVQRKAGEWADCSSLAKEAITHAREALNISGAQQDVAGKAILQYKRGNVQSRKTRDNTWYERQIKDSFIEGEKVRTLSGSYAEILFRNNSRIQLQANSQALIQTMRENRLTNQDQASVSLIEGDVLALLAGGQASEGFDFQVEGVQTEVNSQAFRVNKTNEAASFANYQGELAIAAAGGEVVLEENQGSVVRRNQAPTQPRDLLPSPELMEPINGAELYDTDGELVWQAVEGAERYKVDVAEDAQFSRILASESTTGTSYPIPGELTNGAYYWRVLAFTEDNLPGRMGRGAGFSIILDDTPPFLVVNAPQDGLLITQPEFSVRGATEPGATVTVQGEPAEVDANGGWSRTVPLTLGENLISVVATDRAGNETLIGRTVQQMTAGEVSLAFDPALATLGPNRFVATGSALSMRGTTEPNSDLTFQSLTGGFTITTQADAEGVFQVSLPLLTDADEFEVTVTDPTGSTYAETFTAEVDTQPPVIRFAQPIPSAVGGPALEVSGVVEGGDNLTLNGKTVGVLNGEFVATLTLEKGVNTLRFEAVDAAKNMGVQQDEVLYDPDPPELTGSNVSPQRVSGGEKVEITVSATDDGGLVKAAPYEARIGDYEYKGVLLLNPSGDGYTGGFQAPKNVSGAVKLVRLTLTDRLGNTKTFEF